MLSLPIPFTSASFEFARPFPSWPSWLGGTAAVAIFAALAFALFWLYRYERRLVKPRLARALLGLRLAAAFSIFLVVSVQPTLVKMSLKEVPSRVLIFVDGSDSGRIVDSHRPEEDQQRIAKALKLSGLDNVTRLKLAEQILIAEGGKMLPELEAKHSVELIRFDQTLSALPRDPARLKTVLDSDRALDPKLPATQLLYTDLKLPLNRTLESASDTANSKLIGAILLTDGRHTWGEAPRNRIAELAALKIPVDSVVLAPESAPPDLAIVSAKPQTSTVFKGSTVPVDVQVRVSGWPSGPIRVKLTPPPDENGKPRPPIIETIQHGGQDQTYPLTMRVKLEGTGPQSQKVTVESDGEPDRFPGNNSRTARVNVVKDRARVLLVDGEARWEFHYLQTCLGRDENMDVRSVVFRQPRVTEATDEDLKKFGTPARKLPEIDTLSGYDCLVLGDVETSQVRDWSWLEKYVADDGGTLVIVAGKRAMPTAHLDDNNPLRKLLPLKSIAAIAPKNGFNLNLTADGEKSWFLQLGDTPTVSHSIWEGLPPHYWALAGVPKDGAEVLAEVGGQAVIARQNYGFGRVLYVGIDSTWRWRYRVGDTYHHRFWGQVAQWAASDRLLPMQNASGTIRFGTREPTFRPGQDIEVIARGTDAVKKLGANSLKGARILRLPSAEVETERQVGLIPLQQPEGRPREGTGTVRELTPGRYAIELEIPDWADQLQGPVGPDGRTTKLRSPFEVLPPDNEELLELAADRPFLEELAQATGGKVFGPDQIDELLKRYSARTATVETRTAYPARNSWVTLLIIVLLLATEWALRKWAGLP